MRVVVVIAMACGLVGCGSLESRVVWWVMERAVEEMRPSPEVVSDVQKEEVDAAREAVDRCEREAQRVGPSLRERTQMRQQGSPYKDPCTKVLAQWIVRQGMWAGKGAAIPMVGVVLVP